MDIKLTAPEFYKQKDNALVVDVRSSFEHKALSVIEPSINIHIHDLIQKYQKLFPDKTKMIITYCNAGNRSTEAANFLRTQGYKNAFVLKSGVYQYHRWLKKQIKLNKIK